MRFLRLSDDVFILCVRLLTNTLLNIHSMFDSLTGDS